MSGRLESAHPGRCLSIELSAQIVNHPMLNLFDIFMRESPNIRFLRYKAMDVLVLVLVAFLFPQAVSQA